MGQPPLPNGICKSRICRGGSQTVPANRFVGAACITSRPYKLICRGGCSTSRPYKQVFVGAVQSRTDPTVRFPAKKNQIYNSKSCCRTSCDQRSEPRSHCRTPATNVPNRVRVAERPAINIPNRVRIAERPATNVPNRVRVAERPATATTSTRVFYKLQLKVQFIRIYTIHH